MGGNTITFPDSLLYNEYNVHIWSFCTKTNVSTTCSDRTSQFSFDLIETWQIAKETLPTVPSTALDVYTKVSRYLGIIYIAALAFNLTTLIVGTCSLGAPKFPRTPMLPFLLSSISCVLWLIVSAFITVTFGTLVGTLKATSTNTGIVSSIGRDAFVLVWVAFAFSYMASCTWFVAALFSLCFR